MAKEKLTANDVFWFEGHTGTIYDTEPQAPSNFYRYVFPNTEKGKIKQMAEETPLDDGTLYKAWKPDQLAMFDWLDKETRKRVH